MGLEQDDFGLPSDTQKQVLVIRGIMHEVSVSQSFLNLGCG